VYDENHRKVKTAAGKTAAVFLCLVGKGMLTQWLVGQHMGDVLNKIPVKWKD
jgi:hypothetical protein